MLWQVTADFSNTLSVNVSWKRSIRTTIQCETLAGKATTIRSQCKNRSDNCSQRLFAYYRCRVPHKQCYEANSGRNWMTRLYNTHDSNGEGKRKALSQRIWLELERLNRTGTTGLHIVRAQHCGCVWFLVFII